MSRDRAASLLRWLGALVLLGVLAFRIADAGPIRLSPPETVASLTPSLGEETAELLRFLRGVGATLPTGTRVVVVDARRFALPGDRLTYLVALGQLPDLRVEPRESIETNPPEVVASFAGPFRLPGWRRAETVSGGALYRAKR